MSDHTPAPPTAYDVDIKAQSQSDTKGVDAKMEPAANWSQLEFWGDDGKPFLKEYEGRGLLKDKAAIITGGDSGIGRAAAILFAREGADVTIVYIGDEEKQDADATKEAIEKAGRKCLTIQTDITHEENVKMVIHKHMSTFGKLNCLVNNSAMQHAYPDIKDISLDNVEKTLRTNVWSMFAMTKFAIPHMKRGDTIINSTSIAGYMGNPSMVDYSSSKGAIATFTRSLAQQQAPNGIRVNGVAPGAIWTPFQPQTAGVEADGMKDLGKDKAPLGRIGMPVEMGTIYVFLASPLSSYFTGEVIHGTGGAEMQG